jgi:hypothetical protein
MKLSILFLVTFMALTTHCTIVFGQTYASDSLKNAAESDIKAKNARLGINEVTPTETKEIEKYERFDYAKLPFGIFKLASVKAIDSSKKYSVPEMKSFSEEANEEFELNDMIVDLKNNKMYMIQRSTGKYRTIELERKGEVFITKNCKECQDGSFKIITETANQLILEVKSQDEHTISYQFVLTSIK